jgi:methylmalonyl-CoA/ethylmalonyl-CoA epimerase
VAPEARNDPPQAFVQTLQIGIVVRDLDRAMETYHDRYGIGPWEVFDMGPETVADLEKDERPVDHVMRVATAMVGEVQWELIEPVSGPNIYSEWMEQHGEGLHHLGLGVPDYADTLDSVRRQGKKILQSGNLQGAKYAYLPTGGDLGFITEVFDFPDGLQLTPTRVFPSEDG